MRLVATPVSCGGDQGSATSAITHSLQKDKTKCLDTSVFETVCPRPSLMGENTLKMPCHNEMQWARSQYRSSPNHSGVERCHRQWFCARHVPSTLCHCVFGFLRRRDSILAQRSPPVELQLLVGESSRGGLSSCALRLLCAECGAYIRSKISRESNGMARTLRLHCT